MARASINWPCRLYVAANLARNWDAMWLDGGATTNGDGDEKIELGRLAPGARQVTRNSISPV